MKNSKFIFSPVFMAILMVILAIALGAATFVEKDFGSRAARGMFYNAHWVELIFFLLVVNLTGQIFVYKLYRKEKLTIIIFHLAFIVMIAGAAITRYAGFDGTMSIREGDSSSRVEGNKVVTLPFAIRLDDFVVDRYPGSNSPSGFRSLVTIIDGKEEIPFSIYMNHILPYRGYRFFQSSFDEDEKGTILAVSHDPAGIFVTYTGYILLFLFIILSLLNRNSFFRTVKPGYWSSALRRTASVIVLLVAVSFIPVAKSQQFIPEKMAAEHFGAVLSQDQKGRTKPLYTISNDILRKVAKEKRFKGLTPMQVFMGYTLDFDHWKDVKLIKVADRDLRDRLGLKDDYASFSDIVILGKTNEYLLAPYIEVAYAKPANKRTHFDKEVIKVDERLNICFMMGRGDFLRIFPVRDSTGYWGTAEEAIKSSANRMDSAFIVTLVPVWQKLASGKVAATKEMNPDKCVAAMRSYQQQYSTYHLPSAFKTESEIFYYKANIFEKLFPFYATAGLLLIIFLVAGVITGSQRGRLLSRILVILITTGFMFHTLGLGVRWYISGHSPMSNGYESMLFVSWVTMIAGFIFGRKSMLPLAATTVLAGMTLMVAHMSFMDPEITNLVPVLKSYLLTLHVSVITGSYAFLGLGAILGIIVMVMLIFANEERRGRIAESIDQVTVMNFKTLTIGLYMLTIGTFLGAIWANESWGRYWGWDPKETWSLITVIVYSLVIHSRNIPGMKDAYVFNMLSVVAFFSVLMTYFGVNYYLSGMHSYAGGDSERVPPAVFIVLAVLAVLLLVSGIRYRIANKRAV
jgi:cytochrome c-type biogenesis protein CcsB